MATFLYQVLVESRGELEEGAQRVADERAEHAAKGIVDAGMAEILCKLLVTVIGVNFLNKFFIERALPLFCLLHQTY